MKVNTRLFGEIEIEQDKIICFENGIIGFPDCRNFTLIYDKEDGKKNNISWLQSMDEPAFALPVINPLVIKEDYNPTVEDEFLKGLGSLTPENIYVLVTVTVPQKIENISINLKAPIIINTDERKAIQVIIEDDFPVKYMIYDILKGRKERAGE